MNKWLLLIIFILICTNVFALRIGRPPSLSYPLDEDQISNLNKYLEDLWNIQNGRFEIDVSTAVKSNVKNGEIFILQTGATSSIMWKANGSLYRIAP